MKFYITSVFVISIAAMLALTLGCEDEVWQNSASSYQNCVANIKSQLETYHNKPDMESDQYTPTICMLMEKMLDCSNLLSECMESHLEQAQTLLFSLPINPMEWSPTMDHCQSQQRYKRTPKKRGGSHGGSSRGGGSHGGSSRGGSLGRALSSSIGRSFSRGSAPSAVGGRKSSSGSVLRGLLGNKKSGIGAIAGSGLLAKKGLGSRQSAKKGIFGKVGKFAVAGIAAYGTYKLAKTLTKGLRRGYDDDDCWEYSILRDRYECVCSSQCNVYEGSAVSTVASLGLLAVTTFISIFHSAQFR